MNISKTIIYILSLGVRIYQVLLSPLKRPSCRFYPCCSSYALEALHHHGLRGILLTAKRLLRCHPFNAGGFDPVPQKEFTI